MHKHSSFNLASLLLLVLWSIALNTAAQQPSLYQSAPQDWRPEVIAFPLEFAPEIDLAGRAELRFSPGMFDPDSALYFTYTFLWWLDGKVVLDEQQLSDDMLHYFEGLYLAVSQQQQSTEGFSVQFKQNPDHKATDKTTYTGQAKWIDPFSTETAVLLNINVEKWYCQSNDKTAVFFRLSPNDYAHSSWKTMLEQSAGRCD